MLNKVMIIGHLGRDPEMRDGADGAKIATFSLAATDKWRDKSGERKERTEWFKVMVFAQPLVEFTKSYLKKGARVYIEGSLGTRKYTDKQGVERTVTEVVLFPFRSQLVSLDRASGRGPSADEYGSSEPDESEDTAVAPATSGIGSDMDEEIPF
jgi:single-strand DNA-binding protein